MFKPGFLGTQAPFFMDVVTVLVALLPLALYLGIRLARAGAYRAHRCYQWTLFLLSLLIVGWFEYGVRSGNGIVHLLPRVHLSHTLVIAFLILHIVIAVATTLWWLRTLVLADRAWRQRNLPGGYSNRHIRAGMVTAWGVFLTALSGIWVYLLLFVL